MIHRIDFDDRRPNYQGAQDPEPRPMARIDVLPPAGSTAAPWTGMGLLDTGASALFLPSQIAQRLGIALTGPGVTRMKVWTASGAVQMDQRQIDVQIHGIPVNGVEALFYPNQHVLIGRGALFKFLEAIGFEKNHWLLKQPPSQQGPNPLPTPVAVLRPADPSAGIEDLGDYLRIGGVILKKRRAL